MLYDQNDFEAIEILENNEENFLVDDEEIANIIDSLWLDRCSINRSDYA